MKPASPCPASPRPHSPRPLELRASPTPTTTSESTTSNPVETVSTVTEAVTPAATTVTTAVTTPISSASVATKTRVKLPKITLRRFEGNPLHWTAFWDSFRSTVHENTELSDIDKFNYLSSQLERSAAAAISGLALTEANYPEAIAILQRRFGDSQQIISKHMEALLNLDPVTTYDVKSLRQLYDRIESHVRSLKALGISSDSYGGVLVPTLLSKLPPDIRLIISRNVTESWNLDSLMGKLREELEARERSSFISVPNSQSNQTNKKPKTIPAARTFLSNATCAYCDQQHPTTSCGTVTDIEQRKRILRKAGRCFNCLRKHHLSRDCRSESKCQTCSGRHHTSICYKEGNSTSISRSTASDCTPQPKPDSTSTSVYTNVQAPVLLQTARAIVTNPDQLDRRKEVRFIFDGGSQRSYVTHDVRQQLELATEAIETVCIKTFGSTDDQTQVCDIVRVLVETREGDTLSLPLLSVPYICDPLARNPLCCAVEMYPYLGRLDLADVPVEDSHLNIDILIGADNYWRLVTGEVEQREDCPLPFEHD